MKPTRMSSARGPQVTEPSIEDYFNAPVDVPMTPEKQALLKATMDLHARQVPDLTPPKVTVKVERLPQQEPDWLRDPSAAGVTKTYKRFKLEQGQDDAMQVSFWVRAWRRFVVLLGRF